MTSLRQGGCGLASVSTRMFLSALTPSSQHPSCRGPSSRYGVQAILVPQQPCHPGCGMRASAGPAVVDRRVLSSRPLVRRHAENLLVPGVVGSMKLHTYATGRQRLQPVGNASVAPKAAEAPVRGSSVYRLQVLHDRLPIRRGPAAARPSRRASRGLPHGEARTVRRHFEQHAFGSRTYRLRTRSGQFCPCWEHRLRPSTTCTCVPGLSGCAQPRTCRASPTVRGSEDLRRCRSACTTSRSSCVPSNSRYDRRPLIVRG